MNYTELVELAAIYTLITQQQLEEASISSWAWAQRGFSHQNTFVIIIIRNTPLFVA